MGALTIIRGEGEGKAHPILASPVFVVSDAAEWSRGRLRFEVFEQDAGGLAERLGAEAALYHLDDRLFWGTLASLEPCTSTHPGLSLLRDRPTLLATMAITEDTTSKATQ